MRFSQEEFAKLSKLLPVYNWGLQTLMTKLNIMHEDLSKFQDIEAIDYISSRLKTPESIAQKLHGLGRELTAENAQKYLFDIAGVRIICSFAKDIYFLANLLRTAPDLKIIDEKDYITSPKPSGYRSYHIILEIPVFHSGKTQSVTTEIQIRTEAMNFWSTLEHKVRYKYKNHIPKHLSDELVIIADQINQLDERMYTIHEIISLINDINT